MSLKVSALRGRGRKPIYSPNIQVEGKPLEYIIRKLSPMDILKSGMSGIVQLSRSKLFEKVEETGELDKEKVFDDIEKIEGIEPHMRQIIRMGVVDPKISVEGDHDPGNLPEDTVHISDIAEDTQFLYSELMTFSREQTEGAPVDVKETLEALDLKKTSSLSTPSTESPVVTEDSPTKS